MLAMRSGNILPSSVAIISGFSSLRPEEQKDPWINHLSAEELQSLGAPMGWDD